MPARRAEIFDGALAAEGLADFVDIFLADGFFADGFFAGGFFAGGFFAGGFFAGGFFAGGFFADAVLATRFVAGAAFTRARAGTRLDLFAAIGARYTEPCPPE